MQQTKILIIGGGIAGLSTAWHLARDGCGSEVALLEREEQLASQSSALNAAILRTLSPDPLTTRIALSGAGFLREPPRGFSDVPLLDPRGLVLAAGADFAGKLVEWVKEQGRDLRVEELSKARLRALAPALASDVAVAHYFPEEGQIDIAALVAGFVSGARSGGVTLRRGCRVESLLREGGRVVGARLRGGEEIRAETTVLAAGGWAGGLGRAAGSRVELRPTRRHLMVTAPDRAVDRRWPVVWRLGEEQFYFRPESGGLLLCACDVSDVNPDRCTTDADVREAIATQTARHLPAFAAAGVAHFWCGMRTFTRDGRFAIGPDPNLDGLFWVAGLGGSGMVCAAEVGRIASRLLLGGAVAPELAEPLSPGRRVRRH